MEKDEIEICTEINPHKEIIDEVKSLFDDPDTIYDVAELFKVFGDSTRSGILSALAFGELCVCDLSELLGISISAVSHQLRILRGSKLVKAKRNGKEVFYSLADDHVVKILEMAAEHVKEK